MSLARRVQHMVHGKDTQLSQTANLVEILAVRGDPDGTRFIGEAHEWAPMRRNRDPESGRRRCIDRGWRRLSWHRAY